MLDPAKALFFGSRDYLAVLDQAGRGVSVKRVDAENKSHAAQFFL